MAIAALVAYLFGVNELILLVAGAAISVSAHLMRRPSGSGRVHSLLAAPLLTVGGQPLFADPTGAQLTQLFANMLKIGAVLYGSGYVLLAFLRGDFVDRLGWITEQQLIDAVSIGQVTPGPVFTTATFLGYVIAGPLGAFLATVAIFLPSFVFVGLLTRLTDKLRSAAWSSALLDGVNATSLALMASVSWQLGRWPSSTRSPPASPWSPWCCCGGASSTTPGSSPPEPGSGSPTCYSPDIAGHPPFPALPPGRD